MRIIKQYLLISSLLFALVVHQSMAQDTGKLIFDETEFDFGEIKEEDGPVTHEFFFKNDGNAPVIVSRVKASCGCTTPGWTKEPVAPGERGSVKAQFNPRNRPGNFRKTLTVTHNGEGVTTRVYIKGKVIPRVKTIEELMPHAMGDIRLKGKTVNFGRITTEKTLNKAFEVYNGGTDTIFFKKDYKAPKHISLTFPEKLLPKSKEKIDVAYDPRFEDNLGLNNDGIEFYTNEAENGAKQINVMATISEYFPPMTEEEKANAPQLLIGDRMKDLGSVAKGEKVEESFILQNDGGEKLNIRKVESNCTCLVAELEDYDIIPGGATKLKITFDATTRRGRQTKSVTIYSNDPEDPTQIVTVVATIASGQ